MCAESTKTRPPEVIYAPDDFKQVPDDPPGLRAQWEAMVLHDLAKSTSSTVCYQDWRLFTRAVFTPWHVRDEVVKSVFPVTPPDGLKRVQEALDHCCEVVGVNIDLAMTISPHLLRRKQTVANYPQENSYFRNDIEHALYVLYHHYAKLKLAEYIQIMNPPVASQEELYDAAMEGLKSATTVNYVQAHEMSLPKLIKDAVWRNCNRAMERRRNSDATGKYRTALSMDREALEGGGTVADIVGEAGAQLNQIAISEALAKISGLIDKIPKTRGLLGPKEVIVLRAYCENIISGTGKTHKQLASEVGMDSESKIFGATLSNALKKINGNPYLRKLFQEALGTGHQRE